jgi:hypothetical protein
MANQKWQRLRTRRKGRDVWRLAFTGSVDDIGSYRQHGLQHFLIGGDSQDPTGMLDLLEQFSTEVAAKGD